METIIGWILVALGLITLLVIGLVALVIYSYSRLAISLSSFSAFPEFNLKPGSVIGTLLSLVTGNYVAAAGRIINGVKFEGKIACVNHSLLPLYLPEIEHEVFIEKKVCQNIVHTGAFWLKPGAAKNIPVNMTLSTADMPQVALAGLTHGGVISIEVQSRATFGAFSYLKITHIASKIPDYLPKRPGQDKKVPLKNERTGISSLGGHGE